jgi:hypothetical protein
MAAGMTTTPSEPVISSTSDSDAPDPDAVDIDPLGEVTSAARSPQPPPQNPQAGPPVGEQPRTGDREEPDRSAVEPSDPLADLVPDEPSGG